jgi:hypothetical protein
VLTLCVRILLLLLNAKVGHLSFLIKKMKIGFKVGVIRGARSMGQLSDTGGKRVN